MIRGMGIDLVEIDRIRSAVAKPHFVERVFTQEERAYADAKASPEESYAGMFAAKEAVLKAFGTGLGGADLLEMEVVHNHAGCPSLQLRGKAGERFVACGAKRAFVSISHTENYAVAQVVLED